MKWLNPYGCPLPVETVSRLPRVVWHGTGKVMIEQHGGILVCETNEMTFQTGCGRLIVEGDGLELSHYGEETAIILGAISGIRYGGGLHGGEKGKHCLLRGGAEH